jgi:predicted DNA-binding transcriptional regulator AlpA
MNAIPPLEPADYKWIYNLAPDSKLNKRDLCQLFKISQSGLQHRIEAGTFPPPNSTKAIGKYKNTAQWSASIIRETLKAYV